MRETAKAEVCEEAVEAVQAGLLAQLGGPAGEGEMAVAALAAEAWEAEAWEVVAWEEEERALAAMVTGVVGITEESKAAQEAVEEQSEVVVRAMVRRAGAQAAEVEAAEVEAAPAAVAAAARVVAALEAMGAAGREAAGREVASLVAAVAKEAEVSAAA
jgi:hypothetical protein